MQVVSNLEGHGTLEQAPIDHLSRTSVKRFSHQLSNDVKYYQHAALSTWLLRWEHDRKSLELGYEVEGQYNFRLQLGQRPVGAAEIEEDVWVFSN